MREYFLAMRCRFRGQGESWDQYDYEHGSTPQDAVDRALQKPWNKSAYEFDVFESAEAWARKKPRIFAKQILEHPIFQPAR